MKTFNARTEILKYNRPFATHSGKYELQFQPHLLGSMVQVTTREKDDLCGHWLLADCPPDFVVSLGAAARKLNKKEASK